MSNKIFIWLNEHFNFFRNVHNLKAMSDEFKINQTVLHEADADDLEFILSEARDRLKTTNDIADNLTSRSITLFSFAIAALLTAIGYVATHFKWEANTFVLFPLIFIVWFICSKLRRNIVPNDYFSVGADPDTIVVDGMFTELQGKRPEWYLHIHLIEDYNERIKINRAANESKAETIEEAIGWVYTLPVLAIVLYLIFWVLSFFC
jgi:hypothetical protein